MNIMVTGSGGQLGSEFRALAFRYPQWRFFFFDHHALDVSNEAKVAETISGCHASIVINCAAFTSVDGAEEDPVSAGKVNHEGPAVLARCARERNALLIHFSTYYVFDGNSPEPYRETDVTTPLGVYGRSKLDGERAIREISPSYLIIRTGWLYSSGGQNFLKTMLRLGSERDSLQVVSDRVGTPTYAGDVAEAVMTILAKADLQKSYAATYHYSNEGICSWYDFATSIISHSKLPCRVFPQESSSFPATGPRPWYSALNNSAIKREWGLEIPHWQESLTGMLREMEMDSGFLSSGCC